MATDSGRQWMQRQEGMRPPSQYQPRKLSPAQVDEIIARRGEGESSKALALEFGVSAGRIRQLGTAGGA